MKNRIRFASINIPLLSVPKLNENWNDLASDLWYLESLCINTPPLFDPFAKTITEIVNWETPFYNLIAARYRNFLLNAEVAIS